MIKNTLFIGLLLTLISISTTVNADWVFCANENNQCNFSGIKEVRYGANEQFRSQVRVDSVKCSNSIFGDPSPGIAKHCFYNDTPVTMLWKHCAEENKPCYFKGIKAVSYGSSNHRTIKYHQDGVICSNANFGDPSPNIVKNCYYDDNPIPILYKGNWTLCARENEPCNFKGIKAVRYQQALANFGEDHLYTINYYQDGIKCSNANFGDPSPNNVKVCYVSDMKDLHGTTIIPFIRK